jgi:Trm5-related predicted tRNA methylase
MAEKKSQASSVKKAAPKAKSERPSLWELRKEIDERAHEIYLDRIASHTQGDELSDWLQAETEVKKRHRLK